MAVLKNRAKMSTSTTGTGSPITLGSAEDGYQTFADAGVANADVVRYVIEDGSNWEIGTGTYTASGTTLSRTVSESSNSDAAINLSGSATVFIGATAEDIPALYAENYDGTSPKPSATGTNAVAIGRNATATQDKNISVGTSCDATGTLSSSFGIAADSAGGYSTALGYAAGTSSLGSSSLAAGALSQTAGSYAVAFPNSYASGNSSLSGAISNNTSSYGATGANSVALGKNAKATGANAVSFSGENATASGSKSFAAGGEYQTASGAFAVSLGGSVNTASGEAAYAFGKRALADKVGKYAYGAQLTSTSGATQAGMMVLVADTTDATSEALRSNTNAAGTTNQIILLNNSAYAFHGTIVARQQAADGTACAAWKVEGLIRREGSAGTTVLVNSATTVLDNTPSWGMALSADTTNGGLAITVTGAASTDIRWVATIHTSEVTYA